MIDAFTSIINIYLYPHRTYFSPEMDPGSRFCSGIAAEDGTGMAHQSLPCSRLIMVDWGLIEFDTISLS